MTGRHSVILSPDSVNLVSPPNTTIPNTLTADPRSQYATDFLDTSGHEDALELEECSPALAFAPMFWLSAPRGETVLSWLATDDNWSRDGV